MACSPRFRGHELALGIALEFSPVRASHLGLPRARWPGLVSGALERAGAPLEHAAHGTFRCASVLRVSLLLACPPSRRAQHVSPPLPPGWGTRGPTLQCKTLRLLSGPSAGSPCGQRPRGSRRHAPWLDGRPGQGLLAASAAREQTISEVQVPFPRPVASLSLVGHSLPFWGAPSLDLADGPSVPSGSSRGWPGVLGASGLLVSWGWGSPPPRQGGRLRRQGWGGREEGGSWEVGAGLRIQHEPKVGAG